MSNDELNKYKDLYAEFVMHLAEVHNHHYLFVQNISKTQGSIVRARMKDMKKILAQMQRTGIAAYRESLVNLKEQKMLDKKEKRELPARLKLLKKEEKQKKIVSRQFRVK